MMRLFTLCLCLLLNACSLWPQPASSVEPWLPVLSPETLSPKKPGQSHYALQKVSGERGGEHYVMLFQLQIEPERMVMVGSAVSGNTLFSLDYSGGVLTADSSPLLPSQLHPAFVLADFQLAFWPLAAVQQGLVGSSYRVEQVGSSRLLSEGDEVLAKIIYTGLDPWSGPVTFYNVRWGYQFRIETLQWQTSQRDTEIPESMPAVSPAATPMVSPAKAGSAIQ